MKTNVYGVDIEYDGTAEDLNQKLAEIRNKKKSDHQRKYGNSSTPNKTIEVPVPTILGIKVPALDEKILKDSGVILERDDITFTTKGDVIVDNITIKANGDIEITQDDDHISILFDNRDEVKLEFELQFNGDQKTVIEKVVKLSEDE